MAKRKFSTEVVTFAHRSRRGVFQATSSRGPVAVSGAVPDESAEVLIGKRRKGARQGWMLKVVDPSPARVEPPCPHYGICGGCSSQHLAYPEQLKLKTDDLYHKLRSEFSELEVLQPAGAPSPWFYRSKVEFSFLQAREGLQLGFNRRGRFDRLTDVARCFIAPPGNGEVLHAARRWAIDHGFEGWHPRSHTGQLRYLVLRRSSATGQRLVALVTTPAVKREAAQLLTDRLLELGVSGVMWATQTSVAGAIVPDTEELLGGQPRIEERLGDLRFELSWRSFFQTNPPAYLAMLREARDWMAQSGAGSVLDLYSGVGTIGLFLGPSRLVGVESVEPAVLDARLNAERNGWGERAEFFCQPSEEWEDFQFDLLVLDPPRSGCHPKMVRRVVESGPAKLLYISCNPSRLLEELEELGQVYRPVKARAYDFFPNTRHLELLVWLERR